MTTFEEMGLPKALMASLKKMNIKTPTQIQEKAIPVALEGKDILGSAQTGTGKTAAFGVPLITKLLADSNSYALVMTPTRELASQVEKQLFKMLGEKSSIKTALLIGGEPMPRQMMQLRKDPRIIVGTPGRINDHLSRKTLLLNHTNLLVLDETDRMLDMGFTIQIEEVLKHMPKEKQTLLFSATLPQNIIKIANQYLTDPVRIAVNTRPTTADNIKQEKIRVPDNEKYPTLLSQLEERKGSIIIFVKTKFGSEKISARLSKAGHTSRAIHGDLRQQKRHRILDAFRKKKNRILVATDVAARGLDIPHIEHVINYDPPQSPEDYIHRIGRTARAGATGHALNLVAPADQKKWTAVDQMLDPNAKKEERSSSPQKKTRKKRPGKKSFAFFLKQKKNTSFRSKKRKRPQRVK